VNASFVGSGSLSLPRIDAVFEIEPARVTRMVMEIVADEPTAIPPSAQVTVPVPAQLPWEELAEMN